uniref:Uncharacterized protein n=1 Tax=Arundo donax TaxID=35708 RepID=A0A0A9D3Q6_ARUDO
MASPAAKIRQANTRQSREISGTSAHKSYDHGHASFSPDVYRRQASSYSARSSQVSRSGSFRVAAQRVAGAFSSCFVPRIQVKTEEEEESFHHVSTDSGTAEVIFTSCSVLH